MESTYSSVRSYILMKPFFDFDGGFYVCILFRETSSLFTAERFSSIWVLVYMHVFEIKIYVVLTHSWPLKMLYQNDVIHVDLLCHAMYTELMLGKKVKIRKSGGTISRTLCEYLTLSRSHSHTLICMHTWWHRLQLKILQLQRVGKYLSKWSVV